MLVSAPGQRSVAGGKKDEVVQISAGETQSAFFSGESDPCFAAELFLAFITGRISI
jgi:hypothetical protein